MPTLLDDKGQVLSVDFQPDRDNPAINELYLEPGTELTSLTEALVSVDTVNLVFPSATDGRGLTAARLLRARYGFTGRIRAVGAVAVDLLPLLKRCGVDQFVVDDNQVSTGIKLLNSSGPTYQPGADGPATIARPGLRGRHQTNFPASAARR